MDQKSHSTYWNGTRYVPFGWNGAVFLKDTERSSDWLLCFYLGQGLHFYVMLELAPSGCLLMLLLLLLDGSFIHFCIRRPQPGQSPPPLAPADCLALITTPVLWLRPFCLCHVCLLADLPLIAPDWLLILPHASLTARDGRLLLEAVVIGLFSTFKSSRNVAYDEI